ncbi:MAG TPA: serine hydrolase domain-containing protein [Pyrinomonadaceae bacterium]|jgi:CubicO group peptidase (beta-lactamase class C family)
MKKIILISLAVIYALVSIEAKAQPQAMQNQLPRGAVSQQFLAQYADKLEAGLKGKSVGYSFTVAGGNNFMVSRAGGDARRAPDSNTRKMTADDKFNIASVSKTITAAAVLKLLNEKRISVDTPVHTYLPASWTLGNSFKTVTFRELLTHRAGIRCDKEVTYENLKACVAGGINLRDKATQQYDNSNFALFRFIIPRLNGYPKTPIKIDESVLSSTYAKLYADYVKQNVFAPIGLNGIDLKPIATNPALAYQFPSPVQEGDSFGDMTETSASRGWNMSSKQLAVFLHNLLYTEKILPKTVADQMKNEQLGLWKKDVAGNVVDYEHGGYYPGKDKKGNLFNKGEMNTLALNFSNGVSVAIIVNSQYGPGLSIAGAARAAMKEMLK